MSPSIQIILGSLMIILAAGFAFWGGKIATDGYEAMKKQPAETTTTPASGNISQTSGDGGINLATTGEKSPIFFDNRKTDIEYAADLEIKSSNLPSGGAYETRVLVSSEHVAPRFQLLVLAPSVFEISIKKSPSGMVAGRTHYEPGRAIIEIGAFGGQYELAIKSHQPEEFKFDAAFPK